MSNFNNDLKSAQLVEKELAEKINAFGYTTTSTSQYGEFSGYDLEVKGKKRNYTIEVKHDTAYQRTGFVAVELYKVKDGKKYKSGLSATTADFQIYKLGTDFYSIKTAELKELLKELRYINKLPIQQGGDRSSVTLALVQTSKFKKASKQIK